MVANRRQRDCSRRFRLREHARNAAPVPIAHDANGGADTARSQSQLISVIHRSDAGPKLRGLGQAGAGAEGHAGGAQTAVGLAGFARDGDGSGGAQHPVNRDLGGGYQPAAGADASE